VIDPAGCRKILLGVVDHRVSAERLHQLHIGGAAHSRNVRTEVLRQLNGENSDAPGSAVYEHSLSSLDVYSPQEMQRRSPAKQDRRGFLEDHVYRHYCQRAILRHADVLGMCAELEPGASKYPVVLGEPGRGLAQ